MINTVFNDCRITKPSDQSQRPPDLPMKDPSLDERFLDVCVDILWAKSSEIFVYSSNKESLRPNYNALFLDTLSLLLYYTNAFFFPKTELFLMIVE